MNPNADALPAKEVLAWGVEISCAQFLRVASRFGEEMRVLQAPGYPNHLAWTLGHCAMTMHRAGERLGGLDLPSSSFIAGASAGDAHRFGTESVCTGSTPTSRAENFPALARCIAIFGAAGSALSGAIRACDESTLASEGTFHGGDVLPLWAVSPRIAWHNGYHAGQLAGLLRALGGPRDAR